MQLLILIALLSAGGRVALGEVEPAGFPDRLAGVCFAVDGEFFAYGVVPEDEAGGPSVVTIDGIEASKPHSTVFPTDGGSRKAFALRARPEATPRPRPVVALQWPGGSRLEFEARLLPRWVVYPSQYEFPLRVVSCEVSEDRATLWVYNESNAEKPDAEIRRVLVDGRDMTASCDLPARTLPADRQRFLADQRRLVVPVDLRGGRTGEITLEYRLGSPRYDKGSGGSTRDGSLTVGVRPGLRIPVGVSGGPAIPGTLCVHHGGLAPEAQAGVASKRAAGARLAAPDLPIYFRAAELTHAEIIVRQAQGSDFCVFTPETVSPTGPEARTSRSVSATDLLTDAGLPFVAALGGESLRSDDELEWWLYELVGRGSRGLKWPRQAGVDSVGWATWLESQGRWLRRGWPLPLVASASQPGVGLASWACGTDEVALFVTNQWCTHAPGQASKPYYGVERRGVEISLDLGPDFVPAEAEWAQGREVSPLSFSVVEGRSSTLTLPPFRVGGLVRLRRSGAVAEVRPGPAPTVAGGLEPDGPPFVDLGRIQPGMPQPVSLAVVNRSATAMEVTVTPEAFGPIPAARVGFTPVRIGPGESAVVAGHWLAPPRTGRAIEAVRVGPPGTAAGEGYLVFLEGEVLRRFDANPAQIDFGRAMVGDPPVVRDVRVRWDDAPAWDLSATIHPEDPGLSVESMGGGILRFRLDPRHPGRILGEARISIGDAGAGPFALRMEGSISEPVEVRPSRLVVAGKDAAVRMIQISTPEPARLEVVPPIPAGVSIEEPGDVRLRAHTLRVRLDPTALAREADRSEHSLNLRCWAESGEVAEVRVPLIRVGGRADARGTAADGADELATLVERVDRIVTGFRATPVPEACPNWVLTHTLLPFYPARSRTPAESDEFRRRLDLLFRLAGEEGRGGFLAIYRGAPSISTRGARFEHEHHPAQFLHYLAMCEIPPSQPLNIPGRDWDLRDLYRATTRRIRETGDLSWFLSATLDYQEPGRSWTDAFGRPRRLGDYVEALGRRDERYCDESHRLTGLARVLADDRWRLDPSMEGRWTVLEGEVARALARLRAEQRPDGAFPIEPATLRSDYRANQPGGDDAMVIHYTGHHLEWVALASTPEQLREPWAIRAVDRLVRAIEARHPAGDYLPRLTSEEDCFSAGFLAHAVSGLSRWRDRAAPRTAP